MHAEHIYVGNAWDWLPPRRFAYVNTALYYVPEELGMALMRLVYYFPEIEVHSDREPSDWWEATLLCQKLFGGADLPPGSWGDSGRLGEEARRQLIALATSLPDPLSM